VTNLKKGSAWRKDAGSAVGKNRHGFPWNSPLWKEIQTSQKKRSPEMRQSPLRFKDSSERNMGKKCNRLKKRECNRWLNNGKTAAAKSKDRRIQE